MSHYDKKVDANQPLLVEILRAYGLSVETKLSRVGQGVPDLLVGGQMPCPHCGQWYAQNKLIEVKTALGKLDERQEEWHGKWQGQKDIARNQNDLERIIGRTGEAAVWTPETNRGKQRGGSEATWIGKDESVTLLSGGAYRLYEGTWIRSDNDSGNTGTESTP
jgi:hypothetical protein